MDDSLVWSELDDRAVACARALAADAVQRVGNGHPGTAMALAPAAYVLFQRVLRHDPSDPAWVARDRFVLSMGHASLTLYVQLLLSGYPMSIDDLRSFRTWGSQTPGHPEYGHTPGVEITTGPLGQGLATAVGMAMAERYQHSLLTPDAEAGEGVFDHNIWVFASDGDLQEGVTGEASSLAGHLGLGSLCVVWDNNHISIEGDTSLSFTERVDDRYRAYGWNVIDVPKQSDGDIDKGALYRALLSARAERNRPTLINLESTIAWPAPNAQNTAKAHGAALGDDEVVATKKALGLPTDETFYLPDDVLAHTLGVRERGATLRGAWNTRLTQWRSNSPQRAELFDRLVAGRIPSDVSSVLPSFPVGESLATRVASGQVINALAARLPELWGGSADLGDSNNTVIKGADSFLPSNINTGRVVHFGIREHAMAAIANGIALEGLTRPFVGTFFVFTDYMRPSVRLAALMDLPVTYVWTHDSIGVGEDGPTHQPIEHLWAMRSIPGLAVVRPADAHETALAWLAILQQRHPAGLVLTRQNVPVISTAQLADVAAGGYVIRDSNTAPDVILIATGSEVSLAVSAADELTASGIATRVVSMPCLEWFDAQPAAYRDAVLPPSVRARVSVEAGGAQGWWKYLGDCGEAVSIERFGASADPSTLYAELGVSNDAVVTAARSALAKARS